MKIIQNVNNDGLKKPQTGSTAVFPVDNAAFCEGVEQFAGERYVIVKLQLNLINMHLVVCP